MTLLRQSIARDLRANPHDPKAMLVLVSLRLVQSAMGDRNHPRAVSWPLIVAYRLMTEFLLGLELRPKTRVGPGVAIHHGYGLVVNDQSVIGSDVVLRHGVTIGHQRAGGPSPVLEDGVQVGASALILGGVTIGRGAVIAAGSVVVSDVPPGAVVAGNPAQLVALRAMGSHEGE